MEFMSAGCIKTEESQKSLEEVDRKVKLLLNTIIERCQKERDCKSLQVPLDDHIERVSYYTALPKSLIYKLQITNCNDSSYEHMTIFQHIALLKCMLDFYRTKRFPKYNDIYELLRMRLNNLPESLLQRELKYLGYDYVKTSNGKMILENPKYTFERFRYLNKLSKLRHQASNIYYIDERVISINKDNNKPFQKVWTNDKEYIKSLPDEFIFLHMISRKGFEHGLFCWEVRHEDFSKWVIDILLPKLHPSSTIILNDGPLHGTSCQSISMYNSKLEMLTWLQENNIPVSTNMHKAELYDLINKCLTKHTYFKLDQIVRAHGHEVLRLPVGLYDLTTTELLWNYIRDNKCFDDNDARFQFKSKVLSTLANLPAHIWSDFENKIIDLEKQIQSIDHEIETALEANYTIDASEAIKETDLKIIDLYIDNVLMQ